MGRSAYQSMTARRSWRPSNRGREPGGRLVHALSSDLSNWLLNAVFENYDAIVDAACNAWSRLIADPARITSIGMRDWAHVGPLATTLGISTNCARTKTEAHRAQIL